MGLASMIRHWRHSQRSAREFDALGPEERDALARDIGVPERVLAALANRGPDAGSELERLMATLSLDARRIGRRHAALMRDMSIACSCCEAADRCRRDLDTGRAALAHVQYCPNAETLRELQGGRALDRN